MKRKYKKLALFSFILSVLAVIFSVTANAASLDYSGGSSSNGTGASATTSGFSVSYDDPIKSICGYRFSIVTASGTPKSETKVINIYLDDISEGSTAYSSGQRFIVSSGVVANKKQLANGTSVSSTTSKQSCDYKSSSCGFYSTLPQDPSSMGTWIKKSSSDYLNLQRIYALCGTKLSEATRSDFVLIEPIFWPRLASTKTAATATELAIYGAAVSGGDGYDGCNGNLTNAGTGSLRNICNYVNREFPNSLYISSNTDVYSAVSIKTSGRYTYKNIITQGYGCSILVVKNAITIKKVNINYHPNGGSVSAAGIDSSGFITLDGTRTFHTLYHGESGDTYNASTFGLTRTGHKFAGWLIKGTSTVLNQTTKYASTQYSHYNDSSKTTANTETVTCRLYAQWTPMSYTNTIAHWAVGFNGEGTNDKGTSFQLAQTNYTKTYGETYTLSTSSACTIPNGFKIASYYGTSSISGKWTAYPFGTSIFQNNSSVWIEYIYEPESYVISYDLDGGTNDDNNPNSYNVLYGLTLNNPTKEDRNFLGWEIEIYKNISLTSSTSNWNFKPILCDIKPGIEYNVYINKAELTSGSDTQFTTYIYDFTTSTILSEKVMNFGNSVDYSITCPNTADASHDIRLIIYAGIGGQTSGNAAKYSDMLIRYETNGINVGCDASFSSADDLYSKLSMRITGDVVFTAKWEETGEPEMVIVPIEPNVYYCENTEVYTSFWVVNATDKDYVPLHDLKMYFSVCNSSGQIIDQQTQGFVLPGSEKNLVSFRWFVPNGYANQNLIVKSHIIDGENHYGHQEKSYLVTEYPVFNPPNARYQSKAPENFVYPEEPSEYGLSAKWWEWKYKNGGFEKKQYGIANSFSDFEITAPKSPSAYLEYDVFYIKSGYGFECTFSPNLAVPRGCEADSVNKCTEQQLVYASFPEYGHIYGINNCRSFELVSDKFQFKEADGIGRQHFIPLYFPNERYVIQIALCNAWTPAGCMYNYFNYAIQVNGNMYEDWFIQH